MLESERKTLTDKVVSMTKEMSSIRVDLVIFIANLNGLTVLARRMKDGSGKALFDPSQMGEKTCVNMVDAGKLNIRADLDSEW